MGAVIGTRDARGRGQEEPVILLRLLNGDLYYANSQALQQGHRYLLHATCAITAEEDGVMLPISAFGATLFAREAIRLDLMVMDGSAPQRRLVQSGVVVDVARDPKSNRGDSVVQVQLDGEIPGKRRKITVWTANLKAKIALKNGAKVRLATVSNPSRVFVVTVDLLQRELSCAEKDISNYTAPTVQSALQAKLGINTEVGICIASSKLPGCPAALMRPTDQANTKIDLVAAFDTMEQLFLTRGLSAQGGDPSLDSSGEKRLTRAKTNEGRRLKVLVNASISSMCIPPACWVEAFGRFFASTKGDWVESFYLLLPALTDSTPASMQTVNDFSWRFSATYGNLACGITDLGEIPFGHFFQLGGLRFPPETNRRSVLVQFRAQQFSPTCELPFRSLCLDVEEADTDSLVDYKGALNETVFFAYQARGAQFEAEAVDFIKSSIDDVLGQEWSIAGFRLHQTRLVSAEDAEGLVAKLLLPPLEGENPLAVMRADNFFSGEGTLIKFRGKPDFGLLSTIFGEHEMHPTGPHSALVMLDLPLELVANKAREFNRLAAERPPALNRIDYVAKKGALLWCYRPVLAGKELAYFPSGEGAVDIYGLPVKASREHLEAAAGLYLAGSQNASTADARYYFAAVKDSSGTSRNVLRLWMPKREAAALDNGARILFEGHRKSVKLIAVATEARFDHTRFEAQANLCSPNRQAKRKGENGRSGATATPQMKRSRQLGLEVIKRTKDNPAKYGPAPEPRQKPLESKVEEENGNELGGGALLATPLKDRRNEETAERRKSKRLGSNFKKWTKQKRNEVKEKLKKIAANDKLGSLLEAECAFGMDFWVSVERRPNYFNWRGDQALKSALTEWQRLVRELIAEALLRNLDSNKFAKEDDGDATRWAFEGPAFRAVLSYLLIEKEYSPYTPFPASDLENYPFGDLPEPGQDEVDLERFRRHVPQQSDHERETERRMVLYPKTHEYRLKRAEWVQRALRHSKERGHEDWEKDPDFPGALKEQAWKFVSNVVKAQALKENMSATEVRRS